jgi:UDP-glucose 4-epimerase
MNCLVTGGAGYIGSHVVLKLIEQGHEVIIIDNLTTGSQKTLDHLKKHGWNGKFLKSDIGNITRVSPFLQELDIDICFHFASNISVGESVKAPLKYFENNVGQFPLFLSAITFLGVKKFVLSSSAAVYGDKKSTEAILESSSLCPTSPYGTTKVMLEQMLEAYSKSNTKFKYTSLRYFNVAGCNMEGKIGDFNFDGKENLVPMCLSALAGVKDKIKIYGTDYNTKDGTCIRDYIHVDDLADAHIAIMDNLDNRCYNVGNGIGYSVREIISSCLKICGSVYNKRIKIEEADRRDGDPEYLCADPAEFKKKTKWSAKITNVDDITRSVWNWIRKIKHLP